MDKWLKVLKNPEILKVSDAHYGHVRDDTRWSEQGMSRLLLSQRGIIVTSLTLSVTRSKNHNLNHDK